MRETAQALSWAAGPSLFSDFSLSHQREVKLFRPLDEDSNFKHFGQKCSQMGSKSLTQCNWCSFALANGTHDLALLLQIKTYFLNQNLIKMRRSVGQSLSLL